MIQTAYEIPIPYLQLLSVYNDFDFILSFLVKESSEYEQFYNSSKKYKLLDNSLFEKGVACSEDELLTTALRVKADEIIIPDVPQNANETLKNIEQFCTRNTSNVKLAAVIQGKTYSEFRNTYLRMLKYPINTFCIPFIMMFEDVLGDKYKYALECAVTEHNEYAENRVRTDAYFQCRVGVIAEMERDKIIIPGKRYHLLGCSNPREIWYQNQVKWITSIDSSNPITAGINNSMYDYNEGLKIKPKRVNDYFTHKMDIAQLGFTLYNFSIINEWKNFK